MSWCFKMSLQLPKGLISFVERWPLMNPNDMAFVTITYLIFVLKVGPMLMDKRPPLRLQSLLILYNVIKIVNSSYLAYKFLSYIMDKGLFPRKCEYDDRTVYTIASLYWQYMVTKILDLFDTIFFVIRKKTSQITFLHVYHHVFMVLMSWCCLRYDPSDHWAFMAVVNCTIHVVMYIYYGVSALGPSFAKYLWWKRYLTLMQLMQFLAVIGHIVIQTYTSQCPMRAVSYWIGLANLALFICLFSDFYKKRYISKKKEISFACSKQAIE